MALFVLLATWGLLFTLRSLPIALDDWAKWIPLRCPLRSIFDIACPTCGLGRSLIAACLGQWQAAWNYHPFGLPIFWGLEAWLLLHIVRPQIIQHLLLRLSHIHRQRPWLSPLLLVLYMIWGFFLRSPLA